MVKDLRVGGQARVDGELVFADGRWLDVEPPRDAATAAGAGLPAGL